MTALLQFYNFVDHILQKKTAELKNTPSEINLTSKNIPNAENILIIAGIANKKRLILWEEENQWRYALNRYLSKKVKKNFIVVQPDLDNISVVNAENIIDLNFNNIEPLLNKYKVSSAYTIILNYDNIENKILLDVNHIGKNQNKQIHLNFVNVDRLDYEQLLDIVAKKAVDYLANAQITSDKNLNNNLIRLGINLTDLESWINVKKKIENCNFINQINIESLSRNYAVISVNNTDLNNKIEDNLARLNFSAQKKADDFYTITIN